ncbi:MAG TPA: hypothetical protein VGV93_03660 [Acidimicrobiales bacterium]|nr:hypothetical protein [Acidimicrobiales bacterium]
MLLALDAEPSAAPAGGQGDRHVGAALPGRRLHPTDTIDFPGRLPTTPAAPVVAEFPGAAADA